MLFVQRSRLPARAPGWTGTEGAVYPFWSPNDDYLGFFAQGKLKKIPATGGTPQVLATASHARGGSWGKKDVIIYTPDAGGPMWRIDADGTDAGPLTDKDFTRTDRRIAGRSSCPTVITFFSGRATSTRAPMTTLPESISVR